MIWCKNKISIQNWMFYVFCCIANVATSIRGRNGDESSPFCCCTNNRGIAITLNKQKHSHLLLYWQSMCNLTFLTTSLMWFSDCWLKKSKQNKFIVLFKSWWWNYVILYFSALSWKFVILDFPNSCIIPLDCMFKHCTFYKSLFACFYYCWFKMIIFIQSFNFLCLHIEWSYRYKDSLIFL